MATISYKYGALWPKDWTDDCDRQMWLQMELWNALVHIHHETGDAIRALTPSTGDLAAATVSLEQMRSEAAELESRIKAAGASPGDDRLRLAGIRKALKAVASRRVELARQARAEGAAEQVAVVYDEQQQRFKDARREGAHNGLWWGNYNAIMTSFDGARSHLAWAGGDLREKAFRGEGRLTVQIQGGATAEELFAPAGSGGRNEARLIDGPPPGWEDRRAGKTPPTPGSKRSQRRRLVTLAMTVYTGRDAEGKPTRRLLHVPLVYDRPLPPLGRVQQVVLTRRRGSRAPTGDWRHEVVFTLRVPEPAPRNPNRLAAVHIGWRTVEDGVRVATVADRGGCSYLVLPPSVEGRFRAAQDMMAAADGDAEAMRLRLAGVWDTAGAPATLRADFDLVRRARTGGAIARALRWMDENWREAAPDYGPRLRDALGLWCHQDLAARWMARNSLARTLRHRRDLVRVWVAGLAARYDAVILLHDESAQPWRGGRGGAPLPMIRRAVQSMAPGEIRAAVAMTLKSRGVTVLDRGGKPAGTCSGCGGAIASFGPSAGCVRCSGCGAIRDADDNAALNAFAILTATIGQPLETPDPAIAAPVPGEGLEPARPDAGRFDRRKAGTETPNRTGSAVKAPRVRNGLR